MGWIRFSIMGLMTIVLLAAVGLAALRHPTEWWAGAVFTTTLAALCLSVVGVMIRRGAGRSPWAGFVVFGGAYLALSFGPWSSSEIRPLLLVEPLLDALHPILHGTPAPKAFRDHIIMT